MENYSSNSHKAKRPTSPEAKETVPEEEGLKKVVSGEVIVKKKTLGRRFSELFTGDDTRTIGNYILEDILVPAFKNMIADSIAEGVGRKLGVDVNVSSRSRRGRGRADAKYDYTSHSRREPPRGEVVSRTQSRRSRMTHNFEDITLDTRVEGEEVIDLLIEQMSKFGVATVANLYDLCGITGDYTDRKWGWYELPGASVERIRDRDGTRYLLNLPRPEPID